MLTTARTKNKCIHCLSTRRDIFSGQASSMERLVDTTEYCLERCRICGKEEMTLVSVEFKKVRRNDAQGQRDGEVNKLWRETLQPVDQQGKENKLFTKEYGYNPVAENPALRKAKPPWHK